MVLSVLCVAFVACNISGDGSDDGQPENEVISKAKGIINSTKDKARNLGPDVVEWTEEDIRKIGSWDYKIVRFEDMSDEALEAELNKLGGERWECYWVEQTDEGPRFHFKRTKRSYLRHIPLGDLIRLVTPDGGPN